MLRSSLIYEEALILIYQLQYSLESDVCVSVCEPMLFSRADYVSHLKSHHENQKQEYYGNLSHPPSNNTCVFATSFADHHLN